jgi:hypothetical protein
MTDPVKRLNYFNGQFLREEDFRDEQSYHRGMRQLHNQSLHTYGITGGLKLSFLSGATQVTVGQGSAIDGQGRELVLPNDFPTQDLSGFAGPSTLFVTIAYAENKTNEKSEGGVTDKTRVEELPTINVAAAAPADASLALILGRVTIDSKGVVQSIDNGTGANTRRTAGAVGGDLNVVSLTLADPGVASAQWPRFTATTAGRVDLAGSLKLAGGLDATGGSGIITDNLEIRKQMTVDGPAQLKGGLTVTAGAVQVSDGKVGIGVSPSQAQLHVATDMAVGPVNVPAGYPGNITASGTNAQIGFTRRNLTAWPASPAAGDRYVWYTENGSQASLWTEVNGDLLTVTKDGDLFTKGTITTDNLEIRRQITVDGPAQLKGGLTVTAGAVQVYDGKVGIGVSPSQAQLHVATDMAVGPVNVPAGYPGNITVSGTNAQIGFTRRNLTAWPASPAAGDRYVWYTENGSQASLWAEVNGDLLTVTKDGDLFTKGRIHPGLTNILYAQTSNSFNNLSTMWASVPDLTLTLPAGPGSAIIILNVPNPYATGDNFPGAMFGLSIDGTVSPQFTSFTYSDKNPANPARVPATLVIVVPLKGATQLIRAQWRSVGASDVHIDPPASLTAIIA